MSTLHRLLPLAGAGAFDGRGNYPARRVQGLERSRVHPTVHAAALGSRRAGVAGKAGWRLYLSGRRRLLRSTREAAAMPRFPEPLEFPRLREDLPRLSARSQPGRIRTPHRVDQIFALIVPGLVEAMH